MVTSEGTKAVENDQPESAIQANIGPDFKAGYVALIGRPNVGKSTLMNALLGQKLSIVTPKPQTTRHRVLGILTEPDHQIIFLDTPGLMTPRYKLQEKMVKAAKTAITEADVLLVMIEPEETISEANRTILSEIMLTKKPIILAINKIDLIEKDRLLPMIAAYAEAFRLEEIIPISALKADGLDRLHQLLIKYLPIGLPFYPEDMITDQPERFFVAELIREKIFEKYGEEIPYSTAVAIEEFRERDQGKDYIRAVIYVERDSQKAIVIGKQGMALKQVGQIARQEIELFLGRPVYLELFVKVKEKWRQNETVLRELGFS